MNSHGTYERLREVRESCDFTFMWSDKMFNFAYFILFSSENKCWYLLSSYLIIPCEMLLLFSIRQDEIHFV
jgi:hypothetical protein